jgi:hypothetical protein
VRAVVDQRDLLAAALVTGAAVASVVLDFPAPIRTVFVVPLVLFLPGYAIVSAFFPGLVIPAVERILLAIGVSLAAATLVGLALAASPIGLGAVQWSLALGIPTLAIVFVAWFRRIRRGLVGPGFNFARMPWIGGLMVLVAALIVANVVIGTRMNANQNQSPPPIQLWMVPVNERPNEVLLGVRAGASAGAYRLVISAAGDPIHEFDISLGAEETWEQRVTFTSDLRDLPIVARLYEGESTTEIRFVVLQPQTNAG